MKQLDCLGDICPVPILKLKQQLAAINAGESVLLITDHSCTLTSTKAFCETHALHYGCVEATRGVWEISIHK